MTVSDQQEKAISFGLRRGEKWWRPISIPTGPQELPAWAKGAHVDFRDGWGNFPEIQLRLGYDPLEVNGAWASKPEDIKPVWHRPKPGVYVAVCEGLASVHYHNGQVGHHIRQQGYERRGDGSVDFNRPIMAPSKVLCTTKQEGYAGRSFFIRMAEDEVFWPGQLIELRGPWHGEAPAGFIEVYCHVNSDKDEHEREYRKQHLKHLGPDRCKWWKLQMSFGWYVEQETFFKILAHYQPQIRWAEVDHGNWIRLEPIDPRTGCPKGFTPDQKRGLEKKV